MTAHAVNLAEQLAARHVPLFVARAGVDHCPEAAERAHVLLVEPRGTPTTGDSGAAASPERGL